MSFESFAENSSSCAIDALSVLCKRVSNGFIFSEEYPDEIEQLVQSIVDGEISRTELEKVTSLSVLWNAIVRIARSLSLGNIFTSPNQDYTAIPVHVSRFIGAFLSTFEIILEQNDHLVQDLLNLLFEIFANQDHTLQDMIVQLLKDYKDWFPYSYMFNRKNGKSAKSSFDQVNQYLNAQKKNINRRDQVKPSGNLEEEEVNDEEETYKDEEDDDTLGDSFQHDSFPDILAPNILPLKPFSHEIPSAGTVNSANNKASREYQNAVQRAHSQDRSELDENDEIAYHENPISSNEEFILKSYYDYSSNWSSQAVEEDEDSDRDVNYYVPKPSVKRMTRMKSLKKQSRMKKDRKKGLTSESQLSPETLQKQDQFTSSLNDHTQPKSNIGVKSVSFAQNSNLTSVTEFEDPVRINDDEDTDVVQQFEEIEDFSDQRELNQARKNIEKKNLLYSDSLITIRTSAASQSVRDQIAEDRLHSALDESSIDLSDSDLKRENKDNFNARFDGDGTELTQQKRKAKATRHTKREDSSSQSTAPKLRSVLSDDESNGKTRNLGNQRAHETHFDRRVGDVTPPLRVNEFSPVRQVRDLKLSAAKRKDLEDLDRGQEKSYFRYRNPLDASLEVNKLNRPNEQFRIHDPSESWKTSSSHSFPNFQEILDEDYDNTYKLRDSVASSASGPFLSIPAQRITHAQPKSDKSPSRRSYEKQSISRGRNDEEENIIPSKVCKVNKDTVDKVQEKVKELRRQKSSSIGVKSDNLSQGSKEKENDVVRIEKVNRQLLPVHVLREKRTLFEYRRHQSEDEEPLVLDILRPTSQNEGRELLDFLSVPVTTPILRRISSFDIKSVEKEQGIIPLVSSSTNDGDYLVGKLQQIKQKQLLEHEQFRSSTQLQQSMTIVNLSQSMNEQTYFQQPFQELPMNLHLPALSELAQETGIIFEGFLLKKSSSFLGQWQKRYFVLKESSIHFCELNIYYDAVESLWGMIPLHIKCSIPIFDISSVETNGKVQAQGKEFFVRFVPKTNTKSSFSFSSIFRSSSGKNSNQQKLTRSQSFEEQGNAASDSDNISDTGSVASETLYGGKIKQLLLQAEDSETRLLWVTMLNKALKAAQLEAME